MHTVVMLQRGTHLGPYEIVSALGAGATGEVYRARDPRLGRDVAIKVLAAAIAADPRRRGRLEREARVLAAVNHPAIATVFAIEEWASGHALVMELVEGDTLQDTMALRTAAEPGLPTHEALSIARQVAAALEAAHAQGIVHRDLKPSNIAVRSDGGVKVLDFGLATMVDGADQRAGVAATATHAEGRLGPGAGTPAYMSPEQARGLATDTGTDIWAFGCVLFEMCAGRRAFDGPTSSDVIAAVLSREPDWTSLPATTPERVRRVLRRCLEKGAGRRLRHIADARADLEDAAADVPAKARRPWPWSMVVAGVGAVAVVALFAGTRGRDVAPSTGPTQFVILPPEGTDFGTGARDRTPSLAISSDGEHLVFVATDRAGRRQLWIRGIRSFTAQPLAGTDGAREPFWSPDGAFVGFFAEGKLKKVAVSEGTVTTLANASSGQGGAWSRDGVILFAPTTQSGLLRVDASGGAAVPVTTVGRPEEYGHVYPQFLPDDRHFLYLDRAVPARKGIYVGSLDGAEPRRVLEASEKARFALPDRLLYLRDGRLMSQGFDPRTFHRFGDPVAVADSVGFIATDGRASYDVSATRVLVFRANGLLAASQPVMVDRAGHVVETVGEPGDYQTASISPDGSMIAVEKHDLNTSKGDLWLIDRRRGSTSRLTFDGMHNTKALWSPDGRRIVFTGRPDGIRNLHMKELGAEHDEPLLAPGPDRVPSDWSSDGLRILYYEGDMPNRDIWYLSLPDRRPIPYLRTDFDERDARLSPDGRWVVYQSDETGRAEVYLRSFPDGGGKHQVSTQGGAAPRWSRDGRELFFISRHSVLSAKVQTEGTIRAEAPVVLFSADLPVIDAFYGAGWFDVSGDRFFIVPNPLGSHPPAMPLTVMLEWARR